MGERTEEWRMSEQWEPDPGVPGWAVPDAPPASTAAATPPDRSGTVGVDSAAGPAGQSGEGYPPPTATPSTGLAAVPDGPGDTATEASPAQLTSGGAGSGQQPFSVYQQHYYPFATAPVGPASTSTSAATTRAAAIIQLVQSAVWLFAGFALLVLVGKPDGYFAERVDLEDSNLTFDDVRVGMVFLAVFIFLAVVAMTILAILVLRRINGCRIASAVLQIVFGSLLLIVVTGSLGSGDLLTVFLGLLLVLADVAAAILLFLGSTARYCATRRPAGLRY